jgi:hypothetical protein
LHHVKSWLVVVKHGHGSVVGRLENGCRVALEFGHADGLGGHQSFHKEPKKSYLESFILG